MAVESTTTIAGLDSTLPLAGDSLSEGDDVLRLLKIVLKTMFPGSGGTGFSTAITATEAQLNYLSGVTPGTRTVSKALVVDASGTINALDIDALSLLGTLVSATAAEINKLSGLTALTADLELLAGQAAGGLTSIELGYVNGVTSAIQTQLDAKAASTDVDDLSGVTDAATARTNLGLGSLAVENSIGADNFDSRAAGSYVVAESSGVATGTHDVMTKTKEAYMPTGGTITVDFQMAAANTGSFVTGRIYVNGVAIGTNRTTNSTSYVTYSEDISISTGDLVQIYSSGIGSNDVFIRSFEIKVSNPMTPVITQDSI